MADRTVKVRLEAVTTQYKAALADAGVSTKGLSKQVDQLGVRGAESLNRLSGGLIDVSGKSALAAGAAAAAGVALFKFVSSGVDAYTRLVEQVDAYQDVTGASAEESSRMVAIASALDVEVGSLAQSMFKLSKNVSDNADVLRADGVVIARTKDGQVDLSRTLGNVADAYQRAGAGVAGNKIAVDAFGRSGLNMIDVLERTREELDGIQRAAEQSGRIVSDADIQATLEYKIAMSELGDSVEGLQVKAGRAAAGPLTDLARTAADAVDELQSLGSKNVGGFSIGDALEGVASQIPGLQLLVAGHDDAAEAAGEHARAEIEAAEAIAAEAEEIDLFLKSLDALYAASFSVADAQGKFNEDIANFADQVRAAQVEGDRFATSLDSTTSSGAANRKMLGGMVKDILDTAAAAKAGGQSVEDATAVQRATLGAVLEQLGFNKVAAQEYTNVLLQIPGTASTVITLNTSQAEVALDIYIAKLRQIPNMIQSIMSSAEEHDAVRFRNLHSITSPVNNTSLGTNLGGGGPAATAARARIMRDAAARAGSSASDAAADAEQRARDAEEAMRRAWEVTDNAFELGKYALTDYLAELDRRQAMFAALTPEWMAIHRQREQVLEDYADGLRAVAADIEEAQDIQFDEERLSVEEYKAILMDRHAAMVEAHGYWSREAAAIRDTLRGIDDDIADQARDAAEDAEDAADRARKARDDRLRELVRVLEQEKAVRKKMADVSEQHSDRLAAIDEAFNRSQKSLLDDRRAELLGWADISERAVVEWGNSVSALAANVHDQIATFDEWHEALAAARAAGVSDAVIDLLGLDKGPQALGQLRMFASATEAEIADLNAAVVRRSELAGDQVSREAAATYTELGQALASISENLAAEVEEENEAFLAQQRELRDELAAIGHDTGMSYMDAIKTAMRSDLAAVRELGRELQSAMKGDDGGPSSQTKPSPVGSKPGAGKYISKGSPIPAGYRYLWENSQGIRIGSYDSGGFLPTGLSLAFNGTGRPEPVGHHLNPTINVQVFDANGHLVTDDRMRVVVRAEMGDHAATRTVVGSR